MNYNTFFPYEKFRKNQEEVIKRIEKGARERKNMLLVAPNGTGKTIIALSSLLPLAYQKDLKIIYMCRTHAQNARIIKELIKISDYLKEKGSELKVNGLSIRGRNEMCLNKTLLELKANPREAMAICSDMRRNKTCSYFLNLLRKKNEDESLIFISPTILEKPIDAEELINLCKEKRICPYFLTKYLLNKMRLIICNYQWIFNPAIRENFLDFIGNDLEKSILILDECHNIIDVATEINSSRLTPYLLRLVFRDLETHGSSRLMREFVEFLQKLLAQKARFMKSEEEKIDPFKLLKLINEEMGFSSLIEFKNFVKDLFEFSESVHEEKLANGQVSRDYIGSLASFWLKWIETHASDNYFFCYTLKKQRGKKTVNLEIVALDPREIVVPILKECYTSLSLSGTVNPFVYSHLMGMKDTGKDFDEIELDSPFKKQNIKAIITEGVNTRKNSRNESMYDKMLNKIDEVIRCTPANIGIFCASYKVLNALLERGIDLVVRRYGKKLIVENPNLSASENASLVRIFKRLAHPPNKGAVLLGVCGGRNSEGEDYPGDFMNSVIIAGFPYHLPTPRVDAKIKYYDKVFYNRGWLFAYFYPAMQRANQASGRPIRKIDDKGAIIFMDSRFKEKLNWISSWVRNQIEIVPDIPGEISSKLCQFWKRN
ncbi:MAG: helicase C-terminal domain-containing protein [Promethearchaeota archaeon]